MVREVQITKSAEETEKYGGKVAAFVVKNRKDLRVVTLSGELGSGKTTFVKGFAKGLGVKQRIVSPTFVLIRPLALKDSLTLYHIDLYRLLGEANQLGLDEILQDDNNIVVIEWPEKLENVLPKGKVEIKFDDFGENERRITTSY